MAAALDGVRVVEFARYIAGPYCGMILADLGADVVKVETPSGDPSRREGPWVGGESAYFAQMNRNKRGVVLDPRTDAGRAELAELVREADVLVENFRPGVLEAMGLGREAVERLNPRCITVSASGFGQASPLEDRAAFDCIVQAISGLAWVSGEAGHDEPVLIGTYLVDVVTGMSAAIGALAALAQRERSGRGQHVDATMLDAALALLGADVATAAATGVDPERVGNMDRTSAPANAYRARDGWVYVHAGPDHFWERTLRAAGAEHVLEDERLATDPLRIQHRELADRPIAEWIAGQPAAEVERILTEAGVPVAHVNTISEAIADPRLGIGERLVTVEHGDGPPIPTLLAPVRLSDSPPAIRHGLPEGPER